MCTYIGVRAHTYKDARKHKHKYKHNICLYTN